ncbi:MAG: hypothetical protein V4662_13805 [Verrucomicrobiota bacterium]
MPIPAHITDMLAHIRGLHDHYCARSGMSIMYNMTRENTWKDWLIWSGYLWGKDEISLVCLYLREEIAKPKPKRNEGSLKFTNMIGSPDLFEQDLELARKDHRLVRLAAPKLAKPAPPKIQESQPDKPVNSHGEEALTGPEAAAHFASLFRK